MPPPSEIKVPSIGPRDAEVMCVGEAPGGDEEKHDPPQPFVGKAGQFVERYFGRAGYPWEETFRTNLSKYRPHRNRFKTLLGDPALQEGLGELDEEIERVNPNLIVAFGNWPMYYLTGCMGKKEKPGSGITSWRGSVVPGIGEHVPSAEDRKVLVTYHPAYIVRPGGFGWHPVFLLDLARIKREKDTTDFSHPEYEGYIDPPNLREIAADMMESEWLTVDIETFGNTLACVGFADSKERALTITYGCPDGWEVAQELLKSEQKKNLQFGTFDINYLWWYYGWEVNGYAHDTLIATANLFPEFPRGLDFLASIYTTFPFYKEDRNVWKETGNLRTYWEYNLKDVICQHWIMEDQLEELEAWYGASS